MALRSATIAGRMLHERGDVSETDPTTADDALAFRPLADTARLIAQGALSPLTLVKAFLRRITALDGGLHSYLLVLAERALAEARIAESEIREGRYRGPLHGIPFAVKDNYFTAGVRTCAASRLLLDHVPDRTAAAIARLQAQGAILLGKLNTWEYGTGTGAVHFDLPFPPARNPWGHNRYTGGSSSGAGAALAAGLATFTLGSDTGGSIRLPAASCGVMGLKPSFGLVSRAGILPNCWSLDVAGPFARTAEDLALILGVIAGFDPDDASSIARPAADYRASLADGVAGLRIGLVRDPGLPVAPAIATNLVALARHLEEQGAEIVEFALPQPIAAYQAASSVINWSESYAIHERDFLERAALMGQALRDKMMTGFSVRAVDYLAAQRQRRLLTDELDRSMQGLTGLLLPCTSITAPRIDNADAVVAFTRQAFVAPFNISGHPALALPTGQDEDGLPTSAQLVGHLFAEAALLGVAACCETLTPRRHPPAAAGST